MPKNEHELLPIVVQQDNALIDARLLHKSLRVGTIFINWIKRRIEEYGFENGKDFFPNLEKSTGGRKAAEYLISLDMAKELAMLERNDIGRQIRRYFIQKEKEARGISVLPKEAALFKGLKPRRINDREMYPYREILERAGYNRRNNSSDRRHRYWMHFVKEGSILYITKDFALHLHHQKQVYNNRKTMLAAQPVLPFNFGEQPFEPQRRNGSKAHKEKGGILCK